jgi:hypothetical protein
MKVDLAASLTNVCDEWPDILERAISYFDTRKLDAAYKVKTERQQGSKESTKPKISCKPKARFNQKTSGTQCFCCGDLTQKCPECPHRKNVDHSHWYSKTKEVPSITKKALA